MRAAARRTTATLALHVRRQAVGGFWLVAVLVGLVVAGVLRLLEAEPTRWWPLVVLGESTVTCFYFAAVHVLLERGDGTLAARAVTPLREAEYLAALAVSLALLALAEAAVLVTVAGDVPARWPAFVLGVVAVAVPLVLYGVVAVAGYDTAAAFLLPSGVWTLGLAVPLLPLVGLPGGWWLWLHPLQPAVVLVEVAYDQAPPTLAAPAAVAATAWTITGLAVARRRLRSMVVEVGQP